VNNPTRGQHARVPRFALFGVIMLGLAACAGGPVQAVRVDPKVVHGELAQSAVTTGEPSLPTRNVLFELGLFDRFAERPEAALADLHKVALRGGTFALPDPPVANRARHPSVPTRKG
jgi:hypothetical protein